MLAVTWAAIDNDGRIWVYRTFQESGLTISQACDKIKELTADEPIVTTYLPPDLYARSKESGRSLVEIWCENGIYSSKADNNRVTGHRIIRNMFTPIYTSNEFTRNRCNGREEVPMLMLFNNNYKLIEDLQAIQADKKNAADCSRTPHEITHSIDSLRYLVISHNFTPLDGEATPMILTEEDWDTESAFRFYEQEMKVGFTLKNFI